MRAEIEIGARFGSLKVLSINRNADVERYDGDGVTSTYSETVYEFACDCGKRVRVPAKDFKGKRAVRDCGCGMGYRGVAKELITFHIESDTAGKVRAKAKGMGCTMAQYIRDCLQAGLDGRVKWL